MRKLKLSYKLPAILMAITILSVSSVGLLSYRNMNSVMQDNIFKSLNDSSVLIAQELQTLADSYQASIELDAQNFSVVEALRELKRSFASLKEQEADPARYISDHYVVGSAGEDGSIFGEVVRRWEKWFENAMGKRQFVDVLLVSHDGHIVYSASHAPVFGKNVSDQDIAKGPLAEAVAKTFEGAFLERPYFADFANNPSYGDQNVGFLANAVYNELGVRSGTLVFVVSSDPFQSIIERSIGVPDGTRAAIVDAEGNELLRNEETKLHSLKFTEEIGAAEASNDGFTTLHTHEDGSTVFESVSDLNFFNVSYLLVFEVPTSLALSPVFTLRNTVLVISAITALAAAFIGIFAVRSSLHPLNELESRLHRIVSEKDFTIRTNDASTDEIGRSTQAVDYILENVVGLIEEFKSDTAELRSTAKQVRKASVRLASASGEQSASVEALSSSVEESESQLHMSSARANQVESNTKRAAGLAQQGRVEASKLSEVMTSIDESSKSIALLVKVIEDISFQTNILSLNASIEAARAGANGRGFATVAVEFRNLASKSEKTAKEAANIVGASLERTLHGVKAVGAAEETFLKIASQVESISEDVSEISSAIQQLYSGVKIVNLTGSTLAEAAHDNMKQSGFLSDLSADLFKNIEIANERLRSYRFSVEEQTKDVEADHDLDLPMSVENSFGRTAVLEAAE